MKQFLILLTIIGLPVFLQAQQGSKPSLVFADGHALTLIGQAFPLKNSYHRIDTSLCRNFNPAIKSLLTHSAGLVISFKTNSARIAARWCVTDAKPGNGLTPIMNKGLDLYIKRNGVWQFAGVGRPDAVCNEYVMVENMSNAEKECLLYLPLYDELKSISVGVDSGCYITAVPDSFSKKRVAVYGSSITQGASASRPGMTYLARLSRDMGLNFINLGLSGNGKMEKEVADMVATIGADAFVLDCFANPSPEQITERTAYMVKSIRAAHPDVPIILIETGFRESGNFNTSIANTVRKKNENIRTEFEKLKTEGVKNLYLIRGDDLLGTDHEGTTDGIHPNDLGFDRMLQVIKPEMIRILQ